MESSAGDPAHYARKVLQQVLRERSPSWEQGSDIGHVALELGRRLGLPEDRMQPMYDAAELHGIGKVAIPDQVINKPGPLDDDEWSVMRRHVAAACRILEIVPEFRPATDIVACVYEHWDGSGYPDQLEGEMIPLEARIVHVCVAFHAMTVQRPYRESFDVEEAIDLLEAGSGTQFDPRVISEFITLLRSLVT